MTSKGGSSNSNGGGLQSIPAISKEIVQSLKEIVNCPEAEIYSMLKECNMDPNEAASRLLALDSVSLLDLQKDQNECLDPFHKVVSKRERKKETKDVESRPRGAPGRGSKTGSDHYVGHSGSTQLTNFEQGSVCAKSVYKKKNGVNPYIDLTSSIPTNSINRQPPSTSNLILAENKVMTAGTIDSYSTSSQHQGYQPAWSGPPGRVSMADIVKMGRPHDRAMNSFQSVSHHHVQVPRSNVSHHDSNVSEYHVTKVSELDHELGEVTKQQAAPDDNWSLEHIQVDSDLHVMEPTTTSGIHLDTAFKNISSTSSGSNRISPSRVVEENVGNSSLFNNEICSNMGSYQLHRHNFENHKDEDVEVRVSSVTTNIQHCSVEKDQELLQEEENEEENATVIIPDHLQVQSAECLHISFGSFDSGSFASRTVNLKHNINDASEDVVASPDVYSEARKPEYCDNEQILTSTDENLVHRDGTTMESFEQLSVSEPPRDLKEPIVLRENHFGYPPSTCNYTFENEQQLNAALAHSQSISHIQKHPQFSSALQHTYSNSGPNSLLTSNAQAARESDLQYSPFSTEQSLGTKYSSTLPSIGGTTLPMPDILKAAGFSSNQSAVPGNSIATGLRPSSHPQQQHRAMHPYSQPIHHPLGPFTNLMNYPFLPNQPHSFPYMPSAFQQALANNNPYHLHQQSLASLLPQYKNSVSSSGNLPPQSASGGTTSFGNSNHFPMNPPAAVPGHSPMACDEFMASLQQNENSPLWVHGAGSRPMSGVAPNSYFGLAGQNQQPPAGYRHTQQQQPSSSSSYQKFYQDMASMEEQQHQNPRGNGLVGSQGQSSSKQSHPWQNSH